MKARFSSDSTKGSPAGARRSSSAAGALLAGAVALLALPSAVLAVSSGFASHAESAVSDSAMGGIAAGVDSHLARSINIAGMSGGHSFRFTPAGTSIRPGRSVTVAVRVDAEVAQTITVRKALIAAIDPATPAPAALRIAPNAYSLGVARGYHSFAPALAIAADNGRAALPDLSGFRLDPADKGPASRFAPRISLDEREAAGRAPRSFAGDKDQTVDLGGSYRVTGNLNVTAGVRLSQARDRLQPLADGKQDNQAVYVGTQFRF